jgi:hypothetical protein
MRLSIPAAFLAVVVVWPMGVEAKDLESVIHCAARVFANGIVRYIETRDAKSIEGPNLLLNISAYASFKKSQGHIPEDAVYVEIYDAVTEKAKAFSDQYDLRWRRWTPEAHVEIITCYDELAVYSFSDGLNILDEGELLEAMIHTVLQVDKLRNSE